jgi:hypothetical protein
MIITTPPEIFALPREKYEHPPLLLALPALAQSHDRPLHISLFYLNWI